MLLLHTPLAVAPLGLDIPAGPGGGNETVWIEDAAPAGAVLAGEGETWTWVASPSYSGTQAHQSANVAGIHQHYFTGATATLRPVANDRIFTYVYINPAAPVREIMFQFNDGVQWRRVYWGENLINWGTDNSEQRRYVGPLPATGAWARLEFLASDINLVGLTISGMAFTTYDGQVTYDRTGIQAASGGAADTTLQGSASETDTAQGSGFAATGSAATLEGAATERASVTANITTTSTPSNIIKDIHKLDPGDIVEFFVLDATKQGGDTRYFHAGRNGLNQQVVWQGQTYTPLAIEATGFEFTGQGVLPRPRIKIGNTTSFLSYLINQYADLVGAKLTRKRTLVRYLDPINFTGGNPNADQSAKFPDDVYFIRRKVTENKVLVEFELGASHDVDGMMLPGRQYIANTCPWIYRRYVGSAFDYSDAGECGYNGGAYFKKDGTATSNPAEDVCGHRVSDCKLRFGANSELPYGGFIMVGRLGV